MKDENTCSMSAHGASMQEEIWNSAVHDRNNPCEHHNFKADVQVTRLNDVAGFMADIKINCSDCGVPFRFLGLPPGLNMIGATVSAHGQEARFSIRPALKPSAAQAGKGRG